MTIEQKEAIRSTYIEFCIKKVDTFVREESDKMEHNSPFKQIEVKTEFIDGYEKGYIAALGAVHEWLCSHYPVEPNDEYTIPELIPG